MITGSDREAVKLAEKQAKQIAQGVHAISLRIAELEAERVKLLALWRAAYYYREVPCPEREIELCERVDALGPPPADATAAGRQESKPGR